jgi:hypothetical protein
VTDACEDHIKKWIVEAGTLNLILSVVDIGASRVAFRLRAATLCSMSAWGQGRPDSFASTLKVQRSAVGSGSGRHETARPMSQLGRERPAGCAEFLIYAQTHLRRRVPSIAAIKT